MSSVYTPSPVQLGDITLISDGDPKNAAGVNTPIEAVADGVKYLDDNKIDDLVVSTTDVTSTSTVVVPADAALCIAEVCGGGGGGAGGDGGAGSSRDGCGGGGGGGAHLVRSAFAVTPGESLDIVIAAGGTGGGGGTGDQGGIGGSIGAGSRVGQNGGDSTITRVVGSVLLVTGRGAGGGGPGPDDNGTRGTSPVTYPYARGGDPARVDAGGDVLWSSQRLESSTAPVGYPAGLIMLASTTPGAGGVGFSHGFSRRGNASPHGFIGGGVGGVGSDASSYIGGSNGGGGGAGPFGTGGVGGTGSNANSGGVSSAGSAGGSASANTGGGGGGGGNAGACSTGIANGGAGGTGGSGRVKLTWLKSG